MGKKEYVTVKKAIWGIIGVLVIVAIIVGVYHAKHKPKAVTTTTATTTTITTPHYTSTAQEPKPTPTPTTNGVYQEKGSSKGLYLADIAGNTLYTYSSDSAGVSRCTNSCLLTWPGYYDTGATTGLPTNVGVIKRSDNSKYQYTYKNLPLYYFLSDASAGQTNGDGVAGFQIAKP